MAERGSTIGAPGAEGLAGGPGPTPPGIDDGTPRPLEGAAGGPQDAPRSAARDDDARRAPRGDPEEPDPS